MKREMSIMDDGSSLLQGAEHWPFFWPGGAAAALLVHGFPGTPAEMRPLAGSLRQAGWTVQGVLLPGLGPQIATLDQRRYADWLAEVQGALAALQSAYAPVLLVGYSMGAALSIAAATDCAPDGLVLLAPFWRLGSAWQRVVGTILRPLLPRTVRPLQKVDFLDPQVRQAIAGYMPQLDLEDPAVQQAIRQFSVPVSLLDQVGKAGWQAYRKAGAVKVPLLIVQGEHDQVVKPRHTRRLVRRFRCAPRIVTVDAGHDLIRPGSLGWPAVEQAVLAFAGQIACNQGACPERSEGLPCRSQIANRKAGADG